MNLLAAIQREERKLEKQLRKLQHQLDGVRAAARALGHSTRNSRETQKLRRQFKRLSLQNHSLSTCLGVAEGKKQEGANLRRAKNSSQDPFGPAPTRPETSLRT